MSLLEKADFWTWHPFVMVAVLLITGLYLTARLLFPQARFFIHAVRLLFGKSDSSGRAGEISTRQAFAAALSSSAGIGSIVAVATALHLGGPGAVLWLWIGGLLGMAVRLAEVSLAARAGAAGPGEAVSGGPIATVAAALKKRWKWLAYVFAAALALGAALGAGNTIHSNTIALQLHDVTGVPRWILGIAISLVVGIAVLGGLRRTARIAAAVLPFAALLYCGGALAVILLNAGGIPGALALIFKSAFSGTAAVGGFIGVGVREVVRYGISRGLYSNEAGLGSAAVIHASAGGSSPVRQGLAAMLGPAASTLFVGTITALVILTSGAWQEKKKGELDLGEVQVFAGSVESAKDAADRGMLLSGILNIKDGVIEGGAIFFHERSVIESPKFFLDGKPFSGSVEFLQGGVSRGTLYLSGENEGILGRAMPRHVHASMEQLGRLKMTGYYCVTGSVLPTMAFESKLGLAGKIIVTLVILIFGLLAPAAWSVSGSSAVEFILGRKAVLPYKILFILLNFAGAVAALNLVWTLADIMNALMLLPGAVILVLLAGVVSELIKKYNMGETVSGGEPQEKKPWRKKK